MLYLCLGPQHHYNYKYSLSKPRRGSDEWHERGILPANRGQPRPAQGLMKGRSMRPTCPLTQDLYEKGPPIAFEMRLKTQSPSAPPPDTQLTSPPYLAPLKKGVQMWMRNHLKEKAKHFLSSPVKAAPKCMRGNWAVCMEAQRKGEIRDSKFCVFVWASFWGRLWQMASSPEETLTNMIPWSLIPPSHPGHLLSRLAGNEPQIWVGEVLGVLGGSQ